MNEFADVADPAHESLTDDRAPARWLVRGEALPVPAPDARGMHASMLSSAIPATDYHTGGEPSRIVADPPVPIAGRTVAERRARAIEDPAVQGLRAVLCSEPRGHADMYGGFIVPPDDHGADLGVLFWHKDGFSTACVHGTIALGVWAVETGRIAAPQTGAADVVIDVPSGRVTARVYRQDGRVIAVDFVNVPSWVIARDVPVTTSLGQARVTVAYGGAIYATLPAAQLGLAVTPQRLGDLIALGREIKWALNDAEQAVHPADPLLSGIYGTIWFEDLGDAAGEVHQRNVTVFADGEVDRSPCGSGYLRPARGLGRRRPPARRHRAAARVHHRYHVHRDRARYRRRRRPHRRHPSGHRNGVPHSGARVLDRPVRPAVPRVRAAVISPARMPSLPLWLTAAVRVITRT
jgi:proline racemase